MTMYGKMKPEFKAPWLKALRSGKYGQAKEQLYGGPEANEDGAPITGGRGTYCCLGVLCEITPGVVGRETLGTREYNLDLKLSSHRSIQQLDDAGEYAGFEDSWEDFFMDGELNVEMLDYFGISKAAQKRLIEMNDNQDKTFEQIANWVEKYL